MIPCPYTRIMRGAALLELGDPKQALELLESNKEAAPKTGRGKMCGANIRLAKAQLKLAQLKQNTALP